MVIRGKQEPWGVLPGQVRQQGCLCCLSTDLPLQGGHAKPAEAPVVGTVLKKVFGCEQFVPKAFGCDKLGPGLLLWSILFLSLWALEVHRIIEPQSDGIS